MPPSNAKISAKRLMNFKAVLPLFPQEVAIALPHVLTIHTGNGDPEELWYCEGHLGFRDAPSEKCQGHKPTRILESFPEGQQLLVKGRYPLFEGEGYVDFDAAGTIETAVHGEVLAAYERKMQDFLADLYLKAVEMSPFRRAALRLDQKRSFFFTDVSLSFFNVKEAVKPIYTKELEHRLEYTVLEPILRGEEAKKRGVPSRRGVLLSGTYGVGKSLLAKYIARKVTEAGFSFVYAREGASKFFSVAYAIAVKLQPCILFMEDADILFGGQERDDEVNSALNVLDGVDTKNDRIVVVFSTNYPERLNKALLRPGRLDVLMEIVPPDAETASRLLTSYGIESVTEKDGESIAGMTPAVIRELVSRAELRAMHAGQEKATVQDVLIEAAFKKAEDERITQLLRQEELRTEGPKDQLSEGFGRAVTEGVLKAFASRFD